MPTPTMLEYVVAQLEAARGNWREIQEATQVPMSTIDRIGREVTKNPGVKPVEILALYFRALESAPKSPVRQNTTPKNGNKSSRGRAA